MANHPNQWYQASVKYYALKNGTLAPPTAGTGTGTGTGSQGQGQEGGGGVEGGGSSGGDGVGGEPGQQHDRTGASLTD